MSTLLAPKAQARMERKGSKQLEKTYWKFRELAALKPSPLKSSAEQQ